MIDGKYLRLPKLSGPLLAKVEATRKVEAERRVLRQKAEAFWVEGKTLPAEFAARRPFSVERPLANDTGINVLVDQAHQTSFAVLSRLRARLRSQGVRVCSSVASLESVLAPGRLSRTRQGEDVLREMIEISGGSQPLLEEQCRGLIVRVLPSPKKVKRIR